MSPLTALRAGRERIEAIESSGARRLGVAAHRGNSAPAFGAAADNCSRPRALAVGHVRGDRSPSRSLAGVGLDVGGGHVGERAGGG